MLASESALHVIYGDALVDDVCAALDAGAEVLVVREALRDGPLCPSPSEDPAGFVAVRAHHLATAHRANEEETRAALTAVWDRLALHAGDVVLHVEEQPCLDCATFVACALETLHRAGRAVAGARTGVAIARSAAPSAAVELTAGDVAAGAGVWRLLVAGDEAGLRLTATDLEGQGGMGGYPELPGLLVRRAQGDVPQAEVHP